MQSIKRAPLTEGRIFSKMILFVLPIMATGILQLLYNSADSIIVGRFSGDPNALGAVGSTGTVTGLIQHIDGSCRRYERAYITVLRRGQ